MPNINSTLLPGSSSLAFGALTGQNKQLDDDTLD